MTMEREAARAIIEALEVHGPMTVPELAKEFGRSPKRMWDTVDRMRRPLATLPKRVYVKQWRSEVETAGGRPYLRPVFAVGDAPDVPKPRRPGKNVFYVSYYKRMKMSSVFNLALGREGAIASNKRTAARMQEECQYGCQ